MTTRSGTKTRLRPWRSRSRLQLIPMLDDYQDSLDYLYGRLNYERVGMPRSPAELRLGRMRRLLRRLGDPHDGLRIVHVAGTKGKGSTAAMLAAALSASGVRTGLFCSPHLHRLEERFRDRRPRGDAPTSWSALAEAVRPAVDELDAARAARTGTGADVLRDHHGDGPAPLRPPGGRRRRAGGGHGGPARLDQRGPPARCRSSPASRSTTPGSSARPWARSPREKAGILKRGRPGRQRGPRRRAPRGDPPGRRASGGAGSARSTSISTTRYAPPDQPLDPPDRRPGRGPDLADATGGRSTLPLLGPHQAHNAAVALAGLDALAEQGLAVGREAVVRGFAGAALAGPGRGPGRSPLAGRRRRPQRRLGRRRWPRRSGPASPDAPDPGLRHDPRQGPGGPAPGPAAAVRHGGRDPLRREPPGGRPRGGRRGGRAPSTAAPSGSTPDPAEALATGPPADAPGRPDLRHRLAVPRRRDPRSSSDASRRPSSIRPGLNLSIQANRSRWRNAIMMNDGFWLRIGAVWGF